MAKRHYWIYCSQLRASLSAASASPSASCNIFNNAVGLSNYLLNNTVDLTLGWVGCDDQSNGKSCRSFILLFVSLMSPKKSKYSRHQRFSNWQLWENCIYYRTTVWGRTCERQTWYVLMQLQRSSIVTISVNATLFYTWQI